MSQRPVALALEVQTAKPAGFFSQREKGRDALGLHLHFSLSSCAK